jgi:hypothetical protein
VALAVAGLAWWITRSRHSSNLNLHALDIGGQLRIDWSCNSRVIQQSVNGTLEIEDGSREVYDFLSGEQLRAGSVTYMRTSGNVLVRLQVRTADHATLTEVARFLGPPVATPALARISSAEDAAPANKSGRTAARRDRDPRAGRAQPARQPSKPAPRETRAKAESVRPPVAVSPPTRRRLIVPAADVPRSMESLLPAPTEIAANAAPVMTTASVPKLPAPVKTAERGSRSGRIIWTGRLGRGETVHIFGDHASRGHVTGALPGGPVRVQVFPSELTQAGLRIYTADPKSVEAPEAPGAQNGWNQTTYVLNSRQAAGVRVVEAPGQQNAWNRVSLRAERGEYSIIVLHWERE